nr:MAG TPA: hypothetical protein [Caudoviricetes sp.]
MSTFFDKYIVYFAKLYFKRIIIIFSAYTT